MDFLKSRIVFPSVFQHRVFYPAICSATGDELHLLSCSLSLHVFVLPWGSSRGSWHRPQLSVTAVFLQPFIRCSLQCRDLVDEAKKFHLRPELRSQMQGPRTRARLGERCGGAGSSCRTGKGCVCHAVLRCSATRTRSAVRSGTEGGQQRRAGWFVKEWQHKG